MTKLSVLSIVVSLFAVTLSTEVCCKEHADQKQYNSIFSLKIWKDFGTVEHCNPYPECELWPDQIIDNPYKFESKSSIALTRKNRPERKLSANSPETK